MRIPLEHIRARAAARPAGYFDDVISSGTIEGAELVLSDEVFGVLVAKYNPPSLLMRGFSLASALLKWAGEGYPVVSAEVLFSRSSHCCICPRWDARAQRCLECGCYSLKHWLSTEHCPRGYW